MSLDYEYSYYPGFLDESSVYGIGIFGLIMAILAIVGAWKLFAKAGVPGWLSIIPIVNIVYLVKIALGNGLLTLLLIVPVVNIIFGIYLSWQLGKAFGKGAGFCIGLVLLDGLFMTIMGFDKSKYIGPGGNPTPSDHSRYNITEVR